MLFKISTIIWCYIFFTVKCDTLWYQRRPLVRLRQGLLAGIKTFADSSKIVESFLGIPYAAPPIGPNRFLPPTKHPGWNGTFQAVKHEPHCPQLPQKPGINDKEDCLHLNIWTPENAVQYGPLPVVIFLEGQDFARTSTVPISGRDLAAEGVIVITVNYRLNVFGFFCLGNSKARGNLGLLDQYFALLWVKENIKQFGGDPGKITLYGHSSGATSVMLHMLSPRTAGLFQRAIVASGSAVSEWQTLNDPIVASKEIIRMLGCNVYTVDPVSCLRGKSVGDILQALQEYKESFTWIDTFAPVVDTFLPLSNRYLPEEPAKALKDGTYLQVPILTGIAMPITDPQFGQWVEIASKGYMQLQDYVEKAKIPEVMRLYRFSTTSKDAIFDLIKWNYFSSAQGDTRILYQQLKNLEFEAKIEAPHFMQLSYLMSSYVQPIYAYFIDDLNFVVNTTDSSITTDLLLIFGSVLLHQVGRRRFNSEEQKLSSRLKRFWSDFINFGNPTPQVNEKKWRKYTSVDRYIEYFGISPTDEHQIDRMKRTQFWNQLLPKISLMKSNLSNSIPKELQNSPDPAAGFRHALYTLVGLAIALLVLLLVCIFLLKRRSRERESHLHMAY